MRRRATRLTTPRCEPICLLYLFADRPLRRGRAAGERDMLGSPCRRGLSRSRSRAVNHRPNSLPVHQKICRRCCHADKHEVPRRSIGLCPLRKRTWSPAETPGGVSAGRFVSGDLHRNLLSPYARRRENEPGDNNQQAGCLSLRCASLLWVCISPDRRCESSLFAFVFEFSFAVHSSPVGVIISHLRDCQPERVY